MQSLPRRTPASGFAIDVDNTRIARNVESSKDRTTDISFLKNFLHPYRTWPNKVITYRDVLTVRNRAVSDSVFRV